MAKLEEVSSLRIVLERFVVWRAQERWTLDVASGVRGRIVGFLRAATLPLPPDALRARAESHVVLLDAVASGDPERAEREVEQHVSLATARIRSALLET